MSARPLYFDRLSNRAPEPDVIAEQVSMARLYHNVFGTPEGSKVLDHIMGTLCKVDEPFLSPEPILMADANARRNVGIAIGILALADYDDSKPEVKG